MHVCIKGACEQYKRCLYIVQCTMYIVRIIGGARVQYNKVHVCSTIVTCLQYDRYMSTVY